jgi:hypothetical protein
MPRRARETEAIKSAVALEGERQCGCDPAFAFGGISDNPKEEPRVGD